MRPRELDGLALIQGNHVLPGGLDGPRPEKRARTASRGNNQVINGLRWSSGAELLWIKG